MSVRGKDNDPDPKSIPLTIANFRGALGNCTFDQDMSATQSHIARPAATISRNSSDEPSSRVGQTRKAPIQRTLDGSPFKKPTPTSRFPVKRSQSAKSGYAPPSKYAHLVNNLVDSLGLNLICVFIGLNPGIRTATTGHAYNHPSNLFWRLLHSSGCTPRRCRAEEDNDMPRLYNLGLTNIVSRPTKDGSELSKEEMDDGVAVLDMKIARDRPEAVAIVGKSIWESVWRVRHGRKIAKEQFRYGWQDDTERMGVVTEGDDPWEGARVFVATTTSGLAAGMSLYEKEEVWRGLGEWVAKRRAERLREGASAEEEEE